MVNRWCFLNFRKVTGCGSKSRGWWWSRNYPSPLSMWSDYWSKPLRIILVDTSRTWSNFGLASYSENLSRERTLLGMEIVPQGVTMKPWFELLGIHGVFASTEVSTKTGSLIWTFRLFSVYTERIICQGWKSNPYTGQPPPDRAAFNFHSMKWRPNQSHLKAMREIRSQG